MRINKKEVLCLKRKLKSEGIKGLALDIDDTLSLSIDNLVNEFFQKLGNPENLTAETLIKKYGHTNNVPYWQNEKDIRIIKEINNSIGFHKKLPLIKNANKIVQEINKTVPIVAYITARPVSIAQATTYWLKKHNFPYAPVISRPKNVKNEDGGKWKAKVLRCLYPEILGIVDDNCKLPFYLGEKYKGTVYLYGGLRVKEKNINITHCKNWIEVADKVSNCKLNDDRD